MATKFFCDRCREEMKLVHVVAMMVNGEKRNEMELCSRCLGDLHEFFKPLARSADKLEAAQ
jgi:hypothetical protein